MLYFPTRMPALYQCLTEFAFPHWSISSISHYFLPWDPELPAVIAQAKQAYKQRWPRPARQRYRIKTSQAPTRGVLGEYDNFVA